MSFVVEPSDNLIQPNSNDSSPPIGAGIVLDIGTGDGVFVYQSAQQNPQKFYIGIDANARALEKISEKIHRKPAKGGLPNVLFLQASVEDLPQALNGVADEIHIHFPWGSLLRAVATGEASVLRNLRRVSAPEALLEIVIGLDPERDRTEIERLGLNPLTHDFMQSNLMPRYEDAGWRIVEYGTVAATEWSRLKTSWAKRLQGNAGRSVIYLIAQAE
jgi:16S rRNA (adenine(1408)-N(1))-methyltransferase